MNRYSLLIKENLSALIKCQKNFGTTSVLSMRRPPKEEYENNGLKTRKRTADPFDRRWTWTAKRAEPYNVRGGHMDWTKMTITHRGVQMPGYLDPNTKEFVFVEEMVPEIIVPDMSNCELKPYVSYNVPNIDTPVFDAKELFDQTLRNDIVNEYKSKKQPEAES